MDCQVSWGEGPSKSRGASHWTSGHASCQFEEPSHQGAAGLRHWANKELNYGDTDLNRNWAGLQKSQAIMELLSCWTSWTKLLCCQSAKEALTWTVSYRQKANPRGTELLNLIQEDSNQLLQANLLRAKLPVVVWCHSAFVLLCCNGGGSSFVVSNCSRHILKYFVIDSIIKIFHKSRGDGT